MHSTGFNNEGEQPDETSHVVDILQGMDPRMRKHMIDRFKDMADPSHSSVRAPSYNTDHGGRPVEKAEQSGRRISSCTEASTSRGKGKGKGKNAGRERVEKEREEREREEVNYIQYLPWQFQQYMSHTKDVEGDGHCGFRAIAAHIYGTEECWVQVRHDLIQEINHNRALYNAVYPVQNMADDVLRSLSYWKPTAPRPYWMECMSLGIVIASRYNIVLYTFDANAGSCFTHLPLRSHPVSVQQRQEIAIACINNYFVQLFLRPHHPVPPIPIWWWQNASNEAGGWAVACNERVQLWNDILGVVPGPQFGGNID
ncbi:hypothetical protein Vadar_022071 [Vaccinium darrowii]|uniref:Uncharacterized protein n=1 Tax=Vaccinium darrowii TaxID=229202 RepID=A0ACB7XS42_9ERIC|nr:hypothetical protein Vadar_022071 [Vaccinium darrowii]